MVQGLDRLKRKMRVTIPQKVRTNTEEALKRAARSITDTMEGFAPQDTGKLKGSIGWTMGDPPGGSLSSRGNEIDPGSIVATIYAGDREAFYARWVEFGTQKMSPRPFFFPAYRMHKKGVRGRISRAIKKGIKEGAK